MRGLRRGWRLAGGAAALVRAEPKLVIFPVLSALLGMVAAAAIFGGAARLGWSPQSWQTFALLAAFSYPLTLVGTFFNVAFVSMARRSVDGEPVSVAAGLGCARVRFRAIAAWAVVSSAFGVLLSALQHVRGGWLASQAASWAVGVAWTVVTFFVVPIIALEDVGPRTAVTRSASLFKRRWGEGLSGGTYVTGVLILAVVVLEVVFVAVAVLAIAVPAASLPLFAVAGLAFVALFCFWTALMQAFAFVLYRFATTGQTVGGLSTVDLEGAFKPKRTSRIRSWLRRDR